MHPEIYAPDADYDLAVILLTRMLRKSHRKAADRYTDVHAALRSSQLVGMGEMSVRAGRVEPEHYGDLVQALATLDRDPGSGEFEPWLVKLVLGEEGNIWPERVRPQSVADAA